MRGNNVDEGLSAKNSITKIKLGQSITKIAGNFGGSTFGDSQNKESRPLSQRNSLNRLSKNVPAY
jgi:hypothetical protein